MKIGGVRKGVWRDEEGGEGGGGGGKGRMGLG